MDRLNELWKQFEEFRHKVNLGMASVARRLSDFAKWQNSVDETVNDLRLENLELRQEIQRLKNDRDQYRRKPPKLHPTNTAELKVRSSLHDMLVEFFNEEELKNLAFKCGIEYEELEGGAKSGKAREMILYVQRTNRLYVLLAQCNELRPNVGVDWWSYQY